MRRSSSRSASLGLPLVSLLAAACGQSAPPAASAPAAPTTAPSTATSTTSTPPTAPTAHTGVDRTTFNRLAVSYDLPIFWVEDKNKNASVDPDEVASLLFYPQADAKWTDGKGGFTPEFEAAWQKIAAGAPKKADARVELAAQDLDQGVPTLVRSDLLNLSADEKSFVRHVLAATRVVDRIYLTQKGVLAMASQVPAGDTVSESLFRRNQGPKCLAPKTEKNPQCSAIPGAPKPYVDVYPRAMQEKDPKFCETIEKLPNSKKLLEPFVVVRETKPGQLDPVPYSDAYKDDMTAVANELRAAADALKDPKEAALKAYVLAAATAFTNNDWNPADEAWSKMNATNSKFYLRIGPDETYWEPCSHKAGLHVTFAMINKDSLAWQDKLAPVEQEMEETLAKRIGGPYKARKVTFHLPDFIDIVWNGGDDRMALGATIGQSLPNWGPVAAEGRGRTVAMSNLYTDPDSLRIRREQAESLLTKDSMSAYVDQPNPGLLATILHEATHNLGPAHEYAFKGKTDAQWFGGGLASMLEELKAQSGALYFVEFAKKKGLVAPDLALQTYVDCVVWSFGHISRGMYTPTGERKAYSQLAAIQLGFLIDEGAVTFDKAATAANGKDTGAFVIHYDKLPAAIDKLMAKVGAIKASGDKVAAEALAKRYVDGPVVPQAVIAERALRFPKASFVYDAEL